MTIQEILDWGAGFLNLCALYYVIQLIRCAMFSFAISVVVFFFRKTFFKNRVFLKGALWSLFLPALFVGKMKFFYENAAGVIIFTWWTAVLTKHQWISWLYLGITAIYAFLLFNKRKRLYKLTAGMEKRYVDSTAVYVLDLPVTPFAIGVFRPKIVISKAVLEEYDKKELSMVLLHEKVHIRLGHLIFYFLWDILRILLWINPLLTIGAGFFREDMEEICDRVTIRHSGDKAYDYGRLLLKSIKILQAESKDFNMFATFAGDKEYKGIKKRMMEITRYKPYKSIAAAGILAAAVLGVAGTVMWIQTISYDRCNENDSMFVYGYDGREVTFFDNSDELRQMISYDDGYVYVDRAAFEGFLGKRSAAGDVFIVFGGFYKLPGFVGIGCSCFYETDLEEDVVKIPYENPMDDWRVKLVSML